MTDPFQPKKNCTLYMKKLKRWLPSVGIENTAGLTLDDLEFKIENFRPRDKIKEIIDEIEKLKGRKKIKNV